MERLDKIISATGKYTRREVKALVRQGRVAVDGVPADAPEKKVDPEAMEILVDGVPIGYEKFTYLMLHKPAGVLSAVEDSRQKTVLDLLPPEMKKRGLSPVGRLDKDTEGLLLLTNDGELTHRLLSPKSHVDKVYYARVEGCLEPEDADAFAAGIQLSDFTCLPAGLELLSDSECLVTVHEGKFHQVKRMLAARGKNVTYLKRLRMGSLELDKMLEKGQFRPLSAEELRGLKG
ncbi:MAG: rRNA pseudouridine synthase [Clostridiales bacterium]|nr:rRNA pseudouridine synthase [Candidatus Cacconaster stercorequi]